MQTQKEMKTTFGTKFLLSSGQIFPGLAYSSFWNNFQFSF